MPTSDEMDDLTSQLKHADWLVRQRAIRALGEMGKPAVPILIEALKHTDMIVRRQAVEALGKIGDARAVSALLELLNKRNLREWTTEALGKISAPAVPILIEALKNKNLDIQIGAAIALGKVGTLAIPALNEILEDHNDCVRKRAVYALGKIKHPSVFPTLVEILEDSNGDVRREAVEALGCIGDPRAIPILIEHFDDEYNPVRYAASEALTKIGQQSISALLMALLDARSNIHFWSAVALANFGDARAVLVLATALKDNDRYYRDTANAAIVKFGEKPVLLRKVLAEQHLTSQKRLETLNILRDVRYRFLNIHRFCEQMLQGNDDAVRKGAAVVLELLNNDTLLRPSQYNPTMEHLELLHPWEGETLETHPETLLRSASAPEEGTK